MQMETLHAEDPMAAYMMKQREKTQTKAGIKAKPKYKGPWPANRCLPRDDGSSLSFFLSFFPFWVLGLGSCGVRKHT